MSINNQSTNLILFANTLWFVINFKYDLCIELKKQFKTIQIVYINPGPVFKESKLLDLNSRGVIITRFDNFIYHKLFSLFKFKESYILMTFTIIPIILGSIDILFPSKVKVCTLEGLGKIYSSNKIKLRLFKHFLNYYYRLIFHFSYSKVIVLNYADYAYLLEENICSLEKLEVIPGTGISSNDFNFLPRDNNRLLKEDKSVAFIGRIEEGKGFYKFIATALYYNLYVDKNIRFIVISPESDIQKISYSTIQFLKNKRIALKPYIVNIIDYYKEIDILMIPSVYSEGISRIALEATLLGIPIVSTWNKGVIGIVKDGYSGKISRDATAYGLSFALEEVLNDYMSYQSSACSHSQIIRTRYGSKASLNATLAIINKLV